jgi:hypothetical protein
MLIVAACHDGAPHRAGAARHSDTSAAFDIFSSNVASQPSRERRPRVNLTIV